MTADETPGDLRRRIRELTEENARLAQMVAARDTFLAVAAHELLNPMTPIVGRLSLLRRAAARGTLDPARLDEGLAQLDGLMALFVKRAKTLLDVSRITTGKLRLDLARVDLCEVARGVAVTFAAAAEQAGATIELELPPHGVAVMGDRLSIEEILDNLVSNAIKYGGGKPIHVSATADPASGTARLSVRDGGPGIPAENQARIFERFERVVARDDHTAGFGVGLWIVKQLTQAMAGTIEVISTGEGSTFRITLPIVCTAKECP